MDGLGVLAAVTEWAMDRLTGKTEWVLARVLAIPNNETMSRDDLADEADLTRPQLDEMLDWLFEEGYLFEETAGLDD